MVIDDRPYKVDDDFCDQQADHGGFDSVFCAVRLQHKTDSHIAKNAKEPEQEP